MSKTQIIYKDIAPGADEDAAVTSTGAEEISDVSLLPFASPDAPVASLDGSWLLDGSREVYSGQGIAFISEDVSGVDCAFAEPPSITFTFDEQYTSVGISVQFDTVSGNYCKEMNVKWYQGETLKADITYYPDSAVTFCENLVEAYDRIVITLNKTNLPYLKARVERVAFGIDRVFGMTEIRSANVTAEMSLISTTLPIGKMKWTLDSRQNVDFVFQLKQPVEVTNDENLVGVYYISKHTRTAQNLYNIECEDAIGILEDTPFTGGVYLSGKSAMALVDEIVGGDFEVEYAEGVTDMTLKGVLLSGTKRKALQQVLFAWGVCLSTDGRSNIKIFNLSDVIKAVDEYHLYTGISVETEAITTKVDITAHTYTQDASGSVEIGGVKYKDTTAIYSVTNPNVTASDKNNVRSIADATLVSTDIAQSVAQRVYDYYTARNTAKAKIVWSGERLGDYVSVPNNWGGVTEGHISKMDFVLSNTVAASSAIIGN